MPDLGTRSADFISTLISFSITGSAPIITTTPNENPKPVEEF
jgi:hypothetical protein